MAMEEAPSGHILSDKWTLWAHLPHDTDWSINSYKKIMTFKTLEELISLNEAIPEPVVKKCMLFVMRANIMPIWEDSNNIKGGCFSFKVNCKFIQSTWTNLAYALVSNIVTNNADLRKNINGITVSPKKAFCIIKIWMRNCDEQSINNFNPINGLNYHGCIFKKHVAS